MLKLIPFLYPTFHQPYKTYLKKSIQYIPLIPNNFYYLYYFNNVIFNSGLKVHIFYEFKTKICYNYKIKGCTLPPKKQTLII